MAEKYSFNARIVNFLEETEEELKMTPSEACIHRANSVAAIMLIHDKYPVIGKIMDEEGYDGQNLLLSVGLRCSLGPGGWPEPWPPK